MLTHESNYLNKQIDENYCIVKVIKQKYINLAYFKLDKMLGYIKIDFCAFSANEIITLICLHTRVSNSISFSHAIYIGKELCKAEICIIMHQVYIQD